jgi:hypothetical protein
MKKQSPALSYGVRRLPFLLYKFSKMADFHGVTEIFDKYIRLIQSMP